MQPRADTATRVERFRAWLEEYATALEQRDLGTFERLFTVEATYRPTPFAPVINGRRRIREYLEGVLDGRPSLAITARALGVGSTYAVAHWVSAWPAAGSTTVEDGVLMAAFDPFGRCTSLRTWLVEGERATADAAPAETPLRD